MICGRATNGWDRDPAYSASSLSASAPETILRLRNHTPDMEWLAAHSHKSRFFAVARDMVSRLHHIEDNSWPDHMAWTNLMKIAPALKGNPSDREWAAQKERCINLFREELDTLAPGIAILMTGWDWAYDFLVGIGIDPETAGIDDPTGLILGVAWRKQTRVIVTSRPERKPQAAFVESIVRRLA